MIHIYTGHYDACPLNEKYKIEHELGLTLLSRGLSDLYGINIPTAQLPEHTAANDYGKPFLKSHPEIIFNISHCDGLAACGFSNSPIGIDLERVGPFNPSIMRKLLTDDEKTFLNQFKDTQDKYQEYFYRFWTLKESRIKQAGMGFSMPLQSFAFKFDLENQPLKISCSEENLWFYQEFIEKDCLLAICSGQEIVDVHFHKMQGM